MTDEEHEDVDPGADPEVQDIPPLSDSENPLADPDASEEERREWVPPIP